MLAKVDYEIIPTLKVTFNFVDEKTNEKSDYTVIVQEGAVYKIKYKSIPEYTERAIMFATKKDDIVVEVVGKVTNIATDTGSKYITIDSSKEMESNLVVLSPTQLLEVIAI